MECEVVQVKVPKGFLCCGNHLMIGNSEGGDKVHGAVRGSDGRPWLLVSRPEPIKPDWNPPKLKKGWLTWDGFGWWWWWPEKPVHTKEFGWVEASTADGGDGQEIGEVMAEFLGCPDCDGFDERNCIWEVGE